MKRAAPALAFAVGFIVAAAIAHGQASTVSTSLPGGGINIGIKCAPGQSVIQIAPNLTKCGYVTGANADGGLNTTCIHDTGTGVDIQCPLTVDAGFYSTTTTTIPQNVTCGAHAAVSQISATSSTCGTVCDPGGTGCVSVGYLGTDGGSGNGQYTLGNDLVGAPGCQSGGFNTCDPIAPMTLYVNGQRTGTFGSSHSFGIQSILELNPSDVPGGLGASGVFSVSATGLQNYSGQINGSRGSVYNYGTGIETLSEGAKGVVDNAGDGGITTAVGMDGIVENDAPSGGITTAVGVRGEIGITAGTIGSGWGVLAITLASSGGGVGGLVGLGTDEQTGAVNNVDVLLGTMTIPAGNYALYSASTRPSIYAGSVTATNVTLTSTTAPQVFFSGAAAGVIGSATSRALGFQTSNGSAALTLGSDQTATFYASVTLTSPGGLVQGTGAVSVLSASGTNISIDSAGGTSTANLGTLNATTTSIGRNGHSTNVNGNVALGKVISVNTQATTGNFGVAPIVSDNAALGVTAAVTLTNFTTSGSFSDRYLCGGAVDITGCSATCQVELDIVFTDSHSNTYTKSMANTGLTTSPAYVSGAFYATSGQSTGVSITTTVSGAGAVTYDAAASCQQMN